MPDRYFVLLGGGDLKAKETLPLDRKIAALAAPHAGEKRPCALFIGTASHDFMPYYNTFHKTYTGELGWKTDVALTVFHQPDAEKLDAKFAAADLIYVGGGDTLFMLDHWQKTGLGNRILEAYRRGVVVAGLSAGAICWFEQMYTDSVVDGAPTPYSFHPGLGILPGGPPARKKTAQTGSAFPITPPPCIGMKSLLGCCKGRGRPWGRGELFAKSSPRPQAPTLFKNSNQKGWEFLESDFVFCSGFYFQKPGAAPTRQRRVYKKRTPQKLRCSFLLLWRCHSRRGASRQQTFSVSKFF